MCQITPTKVASTKIQIFSSRQIPYATHVLFYNDANTLVTSGNITLELPYKDALTQNYIYEFSNNSLHIKEGTKLRVYFDAPQQTNEIWIPLSYVTPKLEGYFVTKQLSGSKQEVQVQVGDIDNGNIQIVAGLKKGDTITK